MHHEQDMRFYGGLRKSIPLTFWAMMAGTLAITGVGVIAIGDFSGFGFAGFFSKDAIIESAYMSGTTAGGFAFAVGVLAALLTSFYSWRLIFLTFFGTPRWAASGHIQHALHDAHHGREHEHQADPHPEDEHAGHDTGPHEAGAPTIPEGTGGYQPHESPGRCWCHSACSRSARSSPASLSTGPSSMRMRASNSGAAACSSTRI
jgi:NADH-quinone oxidoreductase subunit L